MPVYEYTALDARGKNASGIVDAESSVAARQKLRGTGVYPISVKESSGAAGKKDVKGSTLTGLFVRVKPAELAVMTKQLATLVGAGFPLVSAMDALVGQTASHAFKTILAQVKDAVVEGNTFADALSNFPRTFSPLYINMVHAGETSGTLEVVLNRLADITEKQQALKNRIRAAMTYPVFMALIGVVVLFLLMTYIIPSITVVFADMNQVLPTPTRVLIQTSGVLRSYWWLLVLLLLAAVFFFRMVRKNEKGRRLTDRLFLRLPLMGPILRKVSTARFSRTLGSLLENGVTLISALEVVKNITGNVLFTGAVEDAVKEVGKGQGLGVSLALAKVFPHLAIQMIEVGEQSGELEQMLVKIADAYEADVESQVMSLTSLLEPVMILVMGVVVGAIVVCICLPIFEMNRLVM